MNPPADFPIRCGVRPIGRCGAAAVQAAIPKIRVRPCGHPVPDVPVCAEHMERLPAGHEERVVCPECKTRGFNGVAAYRPLHEGDLPDPTPTTESDPS